MPILLAIGTGMRRGEVLGLQWQDYDPIQRTLTVQRALSQITTANIIVKGTKTDRDRVIKLNPSLAEEIERHHERTPYNKPTDWICACVDGNHHVPRHFTRYFERLVKNLGIGYHPPRAAPQPCHGVDRRRRAHHAVSERLGTPRPAPP